MVYQYKNKKIDKEKTLTIYIDENDPNFECIEIIRLGTDEHKIFKKE